MCVYLHVCMFLCVRVWPWVFFVSVFVFKCVQIYAVPVNVNLPWRVCMSVYIHNHDKNLYCLMIFTNVFHKSKVNCGVLKTKKIEK